MLLLSDLSKTAIHTYVLRVFFSKIYITELPFSLSYIFGYIRPGVVLLENNENLSNLFIKAPYQSLRVY